MLLFVFVSSLFFVVHDSRLFLCLRLVDSFSAFAKSWKFGAVMPGAFSVVLDVICLCSRLLCFLAVLFPKVEFLGMAGIFGVLLSGVQTVAFEWNALTNVTWTDPVVLFIMGYSIRCQYSSS